MASNNCELCGEPMPEGEQMFKYHGLTGPCPKPPKAREPASPPRGGDGAGKLDCKRCRGTGKISPAVSGETQGPEIDAQRQRDAKLRKYTCPECGGSGHKDDQPSPLPPAAEAGEPTLLPCPFCDAPMIPGEHTTFHPENDCLLGEKPYELNDWDYPAWNTRRAQPIPGAAECSCFSITCAVHGAALYRQPPPAPAPVEPRCSDCGTASGSNHYRDCGEQSGIARALRLDLEEAQVRIAEQQREIATLRNAGVTLLTRAESAEAALATAREALDKINVIRNSIVGTQTINWSEHIYPLVAALEAAGIRGMEYPEARQYFGSLVERAAKAEAELATLTTERDQARAVVEAARRWYRAQHHGTSEEQEIQEAGLLDAIAVLCAAPPSEGGRT